MDLNKTIDHTLLKPHTDATAISRLCKEAIDYQFRAVCVPPYFVSLAKQELQGSEVKLATVVGFPHGFAATMAKVEEIKRATDEGVDEIDAVINLNALKSGDWNHVFSDIDRMVTAVRLRGKVLKIIIESSLLNEAELARVCDICNEVSPDFVKTSTGLQGGATEEVVRYLRHRLKPEIKIKASGGIRDAKAAQALLQAGAERIGTSSGIAIIGLKPTV